DSAEKTVQKAILVIVHPSQLRPAWKPGLTPPAEIYTTPSSTKFNKSISIHLTTASKLSRGAASTAAMDSEIWHNDTPQSLELKLQRIVALPNHYPQ
ncbi:Hypothetical predicted protein, partial [Pelobates cultripes]